MAGLWGNRDGAAVWQPRRVQCRTLDIWRKGSAGAAFERKVFTRCATAIPTTTLRDDDRSATKVRRSPWGDAD
jgi:hypothetical protein